MHEFILPNTKVYKLENGLEQLNDDLRSRYPTAIPQDKRIPHTHETGLNEECGIADPGISALIHDIYKDDFEKWYPESLTDA